MEGGLAQQGQRSIGRIVLTFIFSPPCCPGGSGDLRQAVMDFNASASIAFCSAGRSAPPLARAATAMPDTAADMR